MLNIIIIPMERDRTKTVATSYTEFKIRFWREPRNWTNFSLQLAKQRDLVSLKILEKVYLDPAYPLSLIELQGLLRNITRNKMTIWKHINKLEEVDLVDVVRGRPLFVHPDSRRRGSSKSRSSEARVPFDT